VHVLDNSNVSTIVSESEGMHLKQTTTAITILIILLVQERTLLMSDCMTALATLLAAQRSEHPEPLDLLGGWALLMLQDLKIAS